MNRTSDDNVDALDADERARLAKIATLVTGMEADRAVALLLGLIAVIIDAAELPELWDGISRGAREEFERASRQENGLH